MSDKINRRDFLQKSAAVGAGLAIIPGSTLSAPAITKGGRPKSKINVGVIGSGMRGQSHIELLLNRDDCEATAICDIDQGMIDLTLKLYEQKGKAKPKKAEKE